MPISLSTPLTPASTTSIPRPWRAAHPNQHEQKLAAVALIKIPLQCTGLEDVPEDAQDTHGILLIKRSNALRGHSGQWALPGGKRENQESLWRTACRELNEETGLNPNLVRWQGDLGSLNTGTGYQAQVYLGTLDRICHLTPDGSEATQLSAYPISWLTRDDTYRHRPVETIPGEHFSWGMPDASKDWETPLWGATAFMLLQLRRLMAPQLTEPDVQPRV